MEVVKPHSKVFWGYKEFWGFRVQTPAVGKGDLRLRDTFGPHQELGPGARRGGDESVPPDSWSPECGLGVPQQSALLGSINCMRRWCSPDGKEP